MRLELSAREVGPFRGAPSGLQQTHALCRACRNTLQLLAAGCGAAGSCCSGTGSGSRAHAAGRAGSATEVAARRAAQSRTVAGVAATRRSSATAQGAPASGPAAGGSRATHARIGVCLGESQSGGTGKKGSHNGGSFDAVPQTHSLLEGWLSQSNLIAGSGRCFSWLA